MRVKGKIIGLRKEVRRERSGRIDAGHLTAVICIDDTEWR